jgi:phage terminase large subunit-like protein
VIEQDRVKHVGMCPKIEDQLCTWVQGDKSPDRLNAVVWAFNELMLEKKSGGLVVF